LDQRRRKDAKPQPNCAKRLECAELAPAFEPPHALRQRQQAGRSKRFAWQFIHKNLRGLRAIPTIALRIRPDPTFLLSAFPVSALSRAASLPLGDFALTAPFWRNSGLGAPAQPCRRLANLTPLPFQQAAPNLPQTRIDIGQTNPYIRSVTAYNTSNMGPIA
jgi:hypothetical protein